MLFAKLAELKIAENCDVVETHFGRREEYPVLRTNDFLMESIIPDFSIDCC